jgi:hypothetical protein
MENEERANQAYSIFVGHLDKQIFYAKPSQIDHAKELIASGRVSCAWLSDVKEKSSLEIKVGNSEQASLALDALGLTYDYFAAHRKPNE